MKIAPADGHSLGVIASQTFVEMFERLRLRVLIGLNGALLVVFALMTRVFVARLPTRIAVHFDLHGAANWWTSPSILWALPVTCLMLVVLLYAIGLAVSNLSGTLAPTAQRLLLSVTPSDRQAAKERLRRPPAWAGIGLTLFLMMIEWSMFRVGVDRLDHLPWVFIWYALIGLALTVLLVVGASRSVHEWLRGHQLG